MLFRQNRALLFSLAIVLTSAAGCDDDRGGLTQTNPKIDGFAVGDTDTARPDLSPVEGGTIQVNFGKVDLETTRYKYLFLNNGGRGTLTVYQLSWADGSSPEMSAMCFAGGIYQACPDGQGQPLKVDPGQDLVLRLAYTPLELGADQASFILYSDADDNPQLVVELRGEGVRSIKVCISQCTGDQSSSQCSSAPVVCSDEADNLTADFGEADVGQQVRRRVWVHNLSDEDQQIGTFRFGPGDYNQFELDTMGNQLPGVLPVGQTAEVEIIYRPMVGGEHNTTLMVVSENTGKEIDLGLTGRALAPRVCPDPMAVDFGNVAAGETKTESFKITNCGLRELTIFDLQMNPSSSPDFSLVNTPALPLVLQPAESVDVQVQYAPPSDGSDAGGVDIYSDDPISNPSNHFTGTVSLQGRSVVRACDIQATPYAVNFGGVVVGGTQTVDVIVSNQGTDTCTLTSVEITRNTAQNEFAIVEAPPANSTFAPSDTLLVKVSYSPADLGQDTGILSLFGTDKDTNEIKVDLNGMGTEASVCDLQVTPTSQNYGLVKVNNTKSATVVLTNRGQAACSITSLQLKQSLMAPGDIQITSAPPVPFTLDRMGTPNSSAQIEVTFAPTHPGSHKSYLWINTNDPDLQLGGWDCMINGGGQINPGQACVPLSGSADEGTIAAVPSDLDFGVVTVGCASPELRVTIYNLGGIPINISRIYIDPSSSPFSFTSAPMTPYQLNGGASVELRLRYVPVSAAADRATLYIESDASNTQLLAIPLFGRGTTTDQQTDVFHQPNRVMSDVLFVVDNSGSMSEEQNALATNFSSFINYALSLDVDFQIGVITTEVNDPETNQGNPPRNIYPGVLVQAPGRPKIITNSTPDVPGSFADNVRVGTCCSDEQEAGLEAAWMALSPGYIDDPSKNGGFLREEAKLYIIIVSDEQDQSQGNPDFYVDFFSSIKGYRNTERMAVSAIVGDEPDGCGNGLAESGSRYIEVANRTGGIFQSICTSNWAQALQNLGIDAFAAIREFPLSRPADQSTITVTVDGSTVPKASCNDCDSCPDGWVYYPDTNTICFGANYVPGRGAVIEVDYEAVCVQP
ncbi:MAG: choice-of-anchor D domain-containing protein [Deltaproteobacteria bacterium]|nr:MAG: choice-of-anchor D domain-containing protein [Deltaproteobacteria bacterium]